MNLGFAKLMVKTNYHSEFQRELGLGTWNLFSSISLLTERQDHALWLVSLFSQFHRAESVPGKASDRVGSSILEAHYR